MLVDLDLCDALQAAAFMQLQRLAYQQEAALIGYPKLPPLLESLPELMDSGETVVAWRVGGELLAGLAYRQDADAWVIQRLVVTPTAQRRGLAWQLLQAVIARTNNQKLLVGTAAANLPAIRLYEKAGFTTYQRFNTPDGLALVRLQRSR